MLRALLPPEVVVVETARPSRWEHEPAGEDEAYTGTRLWDYRVGRACARRALGYLGHSGDVARGRDGEPLWPADVLGSITHCSAYAAAAVTVAPLSVGIDVERNVALGRGVVERIATVAERAWLNAADTGGIHWPAVLFSAKESVYKALFPLVKRLIGFQDVELHLRPDNSSFTCTYQGLAVRGYFGASAGLVFSCALVGREVPMQRT